MSAADIAILASVIGVLSSWIGAAFIAGYRWGAVRVRLDLLETSSKEYATRDQLAGVKEDLAEIKGMFSLSLRQPGEGH